MTPIVVAEITARNDGTVDVLAHGKVTMFPTLEDAEAYCFTLGADTVASVQGKTGYVRATRKGEETIPSLVNWVNGVARIGQGRKLHRALQYTDTGIVQCICGCPGTSNNHARITGFWPGVAATCQR